VLECLQRALRVADACMDAAVSVELFVEILNRYVYYFDQENDAVSTGPHAEPAIISSISHTNLGNYKVSQRSHRTHSLESSIQRKCFEPRATTPSLSAHLGLYCEQGIRRCNHRTEVRSVQEGKTGSCVSGESAFLYEYSRKVGLSKALKC
jgi:hypothetical protein